MESLSVWAVCCVGVFRHWHLGLVRQPAFSQKVSWCTTERDSMSRWRIPYQDVIWYGKKCSIPRQPCC